MKQEYFEILISVLKIILMLVTIYVVPKLKNFIEENTTAKQRQELINFANIAIKIAEEYYKDKIRNVFGSNGAYKAGAAR